MLAGRGEAAGFRELTQYVRDETDSVAAVSLFVDVWADYVPTIYDLAKQLLILRKTDEAAAAAWADRMAGLRNGACRYLVERLEQDSRLDAEWQTEMAIDALSSGVSRQPGLLVTTPDPGNT